MSKTTVLDKGVPADEPIAATCNFLFNPAPRKTILVVDDDVAELDILTKLLTGAGYKVLVAEDGEAGIAYATHALPDLILLDVCMPGKGGYSVCTELRKNKNTTNIPIIFKTCLNLHSAIIEGFRVGCDDYVTKPCRHDDLLKIVANALSCTRSHLAELVVDSVISAADPS